MSKQANTGKRNSGRTTRPNSAAVGVCSPTATGHKNQTSIRNFFAVVSRRKSQQAQRLVRTESTESIRPSNASVGVLGIAFTGTTGASTVSQSPSAASTSASSCDGVHGVDMIQKSNTSMRTKEDPSTHETATPIKRRRTTPATYEQLYIDLGQRDFAKPTICSVCGMLAVHGLEADHQRHQAVCQAHVLGVAFHVPRVRPTIHPPLKPCATRIRTTFGLPYTHVKRTHASLATRNQRTHERKPQREAVIIEIRSSDGSAMQQKLSQVRAIVDHELGFVEASSRGTTMVLPPLTAFLCIVDKRVVGMVLVEPITVAYRLLSLGPKHQDVGGQTANPPGSRTVEPASWAWERATEPCPAMMGIYQLWVHAKHRQCGIASALVDAARAHFVFGYHTVPLNRMAFSSPTESGVRFAIQYHQSHQTMSTPLDDLEVLVYDCA